MILWTNGYEGQQQSIPTDLELLMGKLRQMSTHWLCAGRYVEIIQFALDSRNVPGGHSTLEIFNDTRRTSYGLLHRLGPLASRQNLGNLNMSDFLDITFLEEGDSSWNIDPARAGFTADWLL